MMKLPLYVIELLRRQVIIQQAIYCMQYVEMNRLSKVLCGQN